jgi:5'-AMP-activated protein kinase regulatory gamma subunit
VGADIGFGAHLRGQCAHDCSKLTASIGELGVGTYTSSYQLATGVQVPQQDAQPRRPRSRSVVQPASKQPSAETSPAPSRSSPHLGDGPSTSDPYDRFHPLATATLDTTVFDIVHLFSELGVSGVPIVDPATGEVVDLYESIDVVDLIKDDAYHILDLTIRQALARRSAAFPGVMRCSPEDSLSNIMSLIREQRVHRMVIVEPGTARLVGMLTLSDIVRQCARRLSCLLC